MYKPTLKNFDSPFTEIFSLLKHYECTSCGAVETGYKANELKIMQDHVDGTINILSRGLQELGSLVCIVQYENEPNIVELNHIWFFISAVSNLITALNTFRLDSNYELTIKDNSNIFNSSFNNQVLDV